MNPYTQSRVKEQNGMRRKSDMWRDAEGDFLPGESEQQAKQAAAQTRDRLALLEEQLKSQFTSMAAYAQISKQAVDNARAEARADLDREKATVISLVERLRDEFVAQPTGASAEPAAIVSEASTMDVTALARIALLEDKFDAMSRQFIDCLRSQQELANSIAFMFEQQMRNSGLLVTGAESASL